MFIFGMYRDKNIDSGGRGGGIDIFIIQINCHKRKCGCSEVSKINLAVNLNLFFKLILNLLPIYFAKQGNAVIRKQFLPVFIGK